VVEGRTAEALDTYVSLLHAGRAVRTRVERRLAGAGLTPTQFHVLEAILRDGALSQRDLARKVLTSAGNMTELCDKLEARGLIRRTRQERDRRAVLVELTPKGRALIAPLYAAYVGDVAAAMGGLSGEELHRLGDMLRKLGLSVAG
jgi:MarR family 2-MHQ and catechol resistance regulon transcriptional repressor